MTLIKVWIRYFSSSSSSLSTLAIRRETKHPWERRVPLLPQHVSHLIHSGIRVIVQPSSIRAINIEQYRAVGALISDDLSPADCIIGIKEVPHSALIPNKTYCFFSHTHKGQPYNLSMLNDILTKKIRLIDYELITDDHDRRQVMFGKFAGYAGMINGLHVLGLRMLAMGYSTAFLNIGMAHMYPTLAHAMSILRDIGQFIARDGIPKQFGPFVVTFTGSGNVSQGAQHVFRELPHKYIHPSELSSLINGGNWDPHLIYATHVRTQDHVVHKTEPNRPWNFHHYLTNPHEYTSKFATDIASYTTLLVTGHYWDSKFPRLITKQQVRDLFPIWKQNYRMITVADISCDIEGSLEFMSHATTIDEPWFIYDPITRTEHNSINGQGIQIMSVDILPTQLPLEASKYFGDKLLPYLMDIMKGNYDSPALKRATIAVDGKLLPRHSWLQDKLLASGPSSSSNDNNTNSLPSHNNKDVSFTSVKSKETRKRVLVLGSGYVAGPVLDYMLQTSHIDITIATNNIKEVNNLLKNRTSYGNRIQIEQVEVHATEVMPNLKEILSTANIVISLLPATLHVPIAKSCIELGVPMVTASYISPAMRDLNQDAINHGITIMNEVGLDPGIDHLTAKQLIDEVKSHGGIIEEFESWCGGLPAPEYSDNPLGYKFSWNPRGVLMAAMNEATYLHNGQEVNIPGEDLLRNVRQVSIHKGYALEGVANRNSLAYIDKYELDRNQLRTMFRGTLRYQGYSRLLYLLRLLGLLDQTQLSNELLGRKPINEITWAELLSVLTNARNLSLSALEDAVRTRLLLFNDAKGGTAITQNECNWVLDTLQWFNMYSTTKLAFPAGSISKSMNHPSIFDATCICFQDKLQYQPGERDLVIMNHQFGIRTRQGKRENRLSTMIKYGDPLPQGYSAMARTVGLPVAIAADMILSQQITTPGVLAPFSSHVYTPMLNKLDTEGIHFVHKVI